MRLAIFLMYCLLLNAEKGLNRVLLDEFWTAPNELEVLHISINYILKNTTNINSPSKKYVTYKGSKPIPKLHRTAALSFDEKNFDI